MYDLLGLFYNHRSSYLHISFVDAQQTAWISSFGVSFSQGYEHFLCPKHERNIRDNYHHDHTKDFFSCFLLARIALYKYSGDRMKAIIFADKAEVRCGIECWENLIS